MSAQNSISAQLLKKQTLNIDQLIQVDNFGAVYYIEDNILYKNQGNKSINYSNVQFGKITSAVIFNPLKIHLFYQDFNSIVILDNRLAELTKVDFNALKKFRTVTHIAAANDNAIWLFNQITQQLELFDYLEKKTKVTTLPISSDILDLTSNYNHCWLLTQNYLYTYNYTGSIINKIPNEGYTQVEENNGSVYLLKNNKLFFKAKNSDIITAVNHPELLINQFLVTNETLYIYADEMLHQFQLKTD